ncbi:MAG: hypothetical protein J6J33_03710 [Clostridia bacterium]|nr:hypothetical protein [Clostridia bacterium]
MDNIKQEIVEKLARYFQIKNVNAHEIIEPIYQSLMNNVSFDMQKLNSCLEMLLALRDNGHNLIFQTDNNMFDVSSRAGSVQVKGIISNNRPILFFYDKNGEVFFKIKYSSKNGQRAIVAESSINEYDVTPEKLVGIDADRFFYSHNDKVVFDDDLFTVRSRTLAKTGKVEEVFVEEDMCDEYRNFYLFLKNVINATGKKSLDNLTVIKADFLFASFYQNLKELCRAEDELSFPEIVYLMNAVLNGNTDIASPLNADQTIQKGKYTLPVTELGEICAKAKDKKTGSFEIGEGTEKRTINFCCSEKYASLHIMDSNGVEMVTYLIGQTDKGFTFFKAIKDETMVGRDALSRVFTLNLTDSTLRINASAKLDSRRSGNALESDMSFLEDGEIVLVNTKSQSHTPTFANEQSGKTYA